MRNGTNWTQQAHLAGGRAAVSGDTVVVGGSDEASVFVRSGTNWTRQAYLKASNAEANDWFGWSVSVSGDTVMVGAPGEDSSARAVNGNQSSNSAEDSGAAYVFVRHGTNWAQQAYLKASNTGVNDSFGYSVSVSGDTLVIGA